MSDRHGASRPEDPAAAAGGDRGPVGDAPFRDAERWLEERGIDREPLRVEADDDRPPPSAREVARLAEEPPPAPAAARAPEGGPAPDGPATGRPELQDEVSAAVATARRCTAPAPKTEARLAERLRARGHPEVVVDLALARCRDEGVVDDRAFGRAFVRERSGKGHGPFRIRRDMERRGFDRRLVDELLAPLEGQDLEARAFDVALEKARASRTADAEAAFRRVVGYVARRGYPEALARKVARQAVFADRQDREAAER